MRITKLHPDEVDIDLSKVAALVADQFPQWAGLPLTPVKSSGTDNVMLRLGDDLVVRLPRILSAALSLAKELKCASMLGAQLPVPISVPLAEGVPGQATKKLALDQAHFVTHLHALDTSGGTAEELTSYCAFHPATRDAETRTAIASCEGPLDTAELTAAWDKVKRSNETSQPATWIHTDLQPGNLLVADGRPAGGRA